MSRHSKSYGRSKNQCGAGLQFDKLLKVCSNSKKPSAAKTAGALGRFGIASFTSTRNSSIDIPGGGGETESRFKFTKKRQKLSNPSTEQTPPTTAFNKDAFLLGPSHNNNSSVMAGLPYSQMSSGVPPPQPIIKPRKFFKSRGPTDVGESLVKPKPVRPEVTNVIAPIKIPIPKPNKSPKSNKSHSSPEKSLKTLRNATNVSPPNSQPIKLRIFKDKTTSKLVSVSEAPPPMLDRVQLDMCHNNTSNINNNNNTKGNKPEKIPKKRGRKPKNFNANLEAEVVNSTIPFDVHSTPTPIPEKKSGRSTRNSRKNQVQVQEQQQQQQQQQQQNDPGQYHLHHFQLQEQLQSQLPPLAIQSRTRHSDSSLSAMPILSRAQSRDSEMEENMGSENSSTYSSHIFNSSSNNNTNSSNIVHYNNNNKVDSSSVVSGAVGGVGLGKKLEDDAEFQQLSQMLSSMEEESDNYHHHHHQQQQQQEHHHHPHNNPHSYNSQIYSSTSSSSSLSNSVLHHHQFPSDRLGTGGVVTPTRTLPMMNIPSESQMVTNTIPASTIPQQQQQQQQPTEMAPVPKIRDSQDIRAILEDDWDESYDEDASPKKSPPKTSRFDLSAFMPENSNSGSASSSSPMNNMNSNNTPSNAFQLNQNQIPSDMTMDYHHYHQQQQQQYHQPQFDPHHHQQMNNPPNNQYLDTQQHHQLPPPFNAPYAVRNLLSNQQQNYAIHATSSLTNPNSNFPHPSGEMPSIPFINTQQQHSHDVGVVGCTGENILMKESMSQLTLEKSSTSVALNLSATASAAPSALGSCSVPPPSNSQNSISTSSSGTKKGSIFKSRAMAQAPGDIGCDGSKGNPKKRLALYKHKFGGEVEGDEEDKARNLMYQGTNHAGSHHTGGANDAFQDDFDEDSSDPEDLASMRRLANNVGGDSAQDGGSGSGSKVVCKKSSKKLFTVIRNVKPIHELQESGEFHEFDGDIWYILEDLKDKNPMTNRCLSAISLAMRCMEPAFRMHLRAHGTVAEFCKELHDAPNHPILALLAATVLFVLSQDRLNMDLDTDSLRLIIALTKAEEAEDLPDENSEILKHRQRVINLVSEMKNRGHAKHLKLEKITASELALETLLYLTSKRAGEWVKHELRTLLGLDHIVTEVVTSLDWLREELIVVGWSEAVVERLWKIDRCLRVLQQVTFNHEENQRYLLGLCGANDSMKANNQVYQKLSGTPEIFVTLFKFCNEQLSTLPKDVESATVIREILFSVLRVLVNLSHDYRGIVLGSEILCRLEGFLPLCLHSVFHLSSSIPDEKTFDLLMHSLCMLLNLVEHSRVNRSAILSSTIKRQQQGLEHSSWSSQGDSDIIEQPTLDALVDMFVAKEKAAKKEEASTDDILTKGSDSQSQKDSQGKQSNSQNSQNSQNSTESESTNSVQDTIDKLIQTAGKHMENSLIAAYISLLLAYLIMDDPIAAETVRNSMPNSKYLPLMIVLKKLFNFMSITSSASGSLRGLKATAIALKFYAKCDPQSNEELKKIIPD